jgi:hypothetical protein
LQGLQGTSGSQGLQGLQGIQGLSGPSTIINATATTGGTNYYVVGVAATGSNQTPFANTLGVCFNGSNVGIGRINPAALLDVSSDGGRLRITQSVVGSTLNGVEFAGYTGSVVGGLLFNQSSGEIRLNAPVSYFPTIYSNGVEVARFITTGNVGIGTSTPAYKLEVNGSFAATTKSFVIPHPTKFDKKLRYASLEGPENGVYVRGREQTTTIILPDYWYALVDSNTVTVNLTPVGYHQNLYVVSIDEDVVIIGSNQEELDYYYTVYAERKDVEKLQVEI